MVAEAWALAVASSATIAATAEYAASSGHRPTIIVERYDRRVTEAGVARIHQEDGCQVLGLAPGEKDPRSIGPRIASLVRIADLLVARAEEPMRELQRLLEQTVVNVALLNADAHAKNISILHTPRRTITLSPLYDVAPTVWFLPTQTQAALPIGEKWRIREIERRHLLAEAHAWGMAESAARSTIQNTLEAVEAGMASATERFPDAPAAMRAEVHAHMKRLLDSDW